MSERCAIARWYPTVVPSPPRKTSATAPRKIAPSGNRIEHKPDRGGNMNEENPAQYRNVALAGVPPWLLPRRGLHDLFGCARRRESCCHSSLQRSYFAHTNTRACLAARMMMLRAAGARACALPGCRQHQHIFTFNRDAFDSKAGSGMCLPSRTVTLQDTDAARYKRLHQHSYVRVMNFAQCAPKNIARSAPRIAIGFQAARFVIGGCVRYESSHYAITN